MPTHSPSLLNAHQLTCIREERILFEHLNLTINAGDIIQVEGPNGAGKTSLLRILAGLSQPYEGQVFFNDMAIGDEREIYNQNLLYIGHLAGIKGEMTAQENLEFSLSLSGLDLLTAEKTLDQVDLLGFEDALAAHLSAGQHRRIALAKLWQSKAPVWILDEPFTAIDKNGVKKLEELMVNHAQNGGCVILTTHQDLSIDQNLYKKVTLEYRFF
ncbi:MULTISPECIES: cytochrome c biogenesis heme-transporting ATPase CcmA [Thalassotalea]|uniref:Cytochrome c biogenesis heme-transporting ATPase CcmA n=1 Tax=Thalassotalea castellviae TaxID=3075612 RepID=A0ABU2ZYW3_9GAMM|nr:cytochrome c biogenesis heme-transporting ATPase CcmA [Thalassotalea sp. W431]MDT0603116.1 cytochrome c biogenesis heme-transporting ATPase CcmA [Thalassotalea sp. W431]